MKTCTVSVLGAAVAGSLMVGQATADSGASRPRLILHLLMDDFGWADVGLLPLPFSLSRACDRSSHLGWILLICFTLFVFLFIRLP